MNRRYTRQADGKEAAVRVEAGSQQVCVETLTAYYANGNINIFPCPDELQKHPALGRMSSSYRGRITVDEMGMTQVKAYREGAHGPCYHELFATEHCRLLRTRCGTILEKWHFGNKLSLADICEARRREMPAVDAFFRSRKEDTQWL